MIKRLTLTNWRAYDQLTIDLSPGATFIVAANGVGKTSIVLALGWAVFGDSSGISGADCVRAGADRTEVTVELTLTGDVPMQVTRSSGLKGRETVSYVHGGKKVTKTEGIEALEAEFGAPLDVAARLCMMRSVEGDTTDALDLKDHLYRAFGVADLLESKIAAESKLAEIRKARKVLGAEEKNEQGDRNAIEREMEALIERATELEQKRAVINDNLRAQATQAELRQSWDDFDRQRSAREELIANLAQDATASGLEDGDKLMEAAEVDAAAQVLLGSVSEVEERQATAAGAAAAASHALEQLDGTDSQSECPTCRRPFEPGDLDHARAQHEEDRHSNQHNQAAASLELKTLRARLRQIDSLRARIAAIPPAPIAPDHPRPEPTQSRADARNLDDQAQSISTELGAIAAQLETLQKQLDVITNSQDRYRQLVAIYRQEALVEAAVRTLGETADRITEERIDPLAAEVRWRWKLLFGSDGLELRPDGSIIRRVGDRELGWDSLSGGERIWASLVTHLLVLTVSTTLPFAWFDEPLEHLDPSARRAVAASLASATRAGGPPQLIITTYEHAIARQLAHDSGHATIQYVRSQELS